MISLTKADFRRNSLWLSVGRGNLTLNALKFFVGDEELELLSLVFEALKMAPFFVVSKGD